MYKQICKNLNKKTTREKDKDMVWYSKINSNGT